MSLQRKVKVYAYVTRQRNSQTQVLVFDHVGDYPGAGTQVPGGTVEEGEPLEQAVLREVFEEAGLTDLTVVREVGVEEMMVAEKGPLQERHFFHLTAGRELSDGWNHIVSDGVADKGMCFRYFWMDLREAAPLLAGNQGCCLPALFN